MTDDKKKTGFGAVREMQKRKREHEVSEHWFVPRKLIRAKDALQLTKKRGTGEAINLTAFCQSQNKKHIKGPPAMQKNKSAIRILIAR